jgi:hypothetical protein
MLKPFTTKIQTALTDRVNEIEEQLLMPDGQYQALNTKINEVLDQIGQNLSPGKERLLFELDEVWVERDILTNQRLYRQGLRDGMIFNLVMLGAIEHLLQAFLYIRKKSEGAPS